MGIRGIYTGVRIECEESGFSKQSWLVTWPRDLTESRVNRIASLDFLSCNALAGVTVHLLCMFHSYASSGNSPATSHPRVPVSLHNLEHFFTLSHTLPLHESHLNIGLLIAKLQANLARNKANKMVD